MGDGRLILLRGPDQDDLELCGDEELLRDLVSALDGHATTGEIATRLAGGHAVEPAAVAAAIDALDAAGALEDARAEQALLAPEVAERFSRQLAFFSDVRPGGAPECQRRLGDATVCLIGLGGLGSWVALALASAGIGRIVGVDGDDVELSNLNRQILFTEADVGRRKAPAAAAHLSAFNSTLRFEAVDRRLADLASVREVIRGADMVVDTADWPAHKIGSWVDEACFDQGTPYVACSQHPPKVRIGPTHVPGVTGCGACQRDEFARSAPNLARLEGATQLYAPSATFGPACGVVGAMVAADVVAQLSGIYAPATLGAAFIVDLRDLGVLRRPVPSAPGCARCGASKRGRLSTGPR